MILNREYKLPHVVFASSLPRRFASVLDRRNQNGNENADDPNDDQDLNKRNSDASRYHDISFWRLADRRPPKSGIALQMLCGVLIGQSG